MMVRCYCFNGELFDNSDHKIDMALPFPLQMIHTNFAQICMTLKQF